MKFSLAWLKQYLDTDATAAEIAARLNALGIEVEGIEDPAVRLAGFRVAKVLAAAPHPNADKLQVLTVDSGDGNPLQVVCGAPNARAGLVGVLGTPGAIVPAGGFELRKSAIRGVESSGMMLDQRLFERLPAPLQAVWLGNRCPSRSSKISVRRSWKASRWTARGRR